VPQVSLSANGLLADFDSVHSISSLNADHSLTGRGDMRGAVSSPGLGRCANPTLLRGLLCIIAALDPMG
jgi:hypothetical protein